MVPVYSLVPVVDNNTLTAVIYKSVNIVNAAIVKKNPPPRIWVIAETIKAKAIVYSLCGKESRTIKLN